MLIYSARAQGYDGTPVDDMRRFEATGDFVSAVFRMPHASDPARFKRIVEQMRSVELVALSQYRGGAVKRPSNT